MKNNKDYYINYLVDCLGYVEQELQELCNTEGVNSLKDLIQDKEELKQFNK